MESYINISKYVFLRKYACDDLLFCRLWKLTRKKLKYG